MYRMLPAEGGRSGGGSTRAWPEEEDALGEEEEAAEEAEEEEEDEYEEEEEADTEEAGAAPRAAPALEKGRRSSAGARQRRGRVLHLARLLVVLIFLVRSRRALLALLLALLGVVVRRHGAKVGAVGAARVGEQPAACKPLEALVAGASELQHKIVLAGLACCSLPALFQADCVGRALKVETFLDELLIRAAQRVRCAGLRLGLGKRAQVGCVAEQRTKASVEDGAVEEGNAHGRGNEGTHHLIHLDTLAHQIQLAERLQAQRRPDL